MNEDAFLSGDPGDVGPNLEPSGFSIPGRVLGHYLVCNLGSVDVAQSLNHGDL